MKLHNSAKVIFFTFLIIFSSIALANELNCKIWGSSEKSRVLKTLGDKVIDTRLIGDPHGAKIHVVEMNKVKRKDYLQDILMKFPNEFQSILGIVPTGNILLL